MIQRGRRVGPAVLSVPITIVGANFANEYAKNEKKKASKRSKMKLEGDSRGSIDGGMSKSRPRPDDDFEGEGEEGAPGSNGTNGLGTRTVKSAQSGTSTAMKALQTACSGLRDVSKSHAEMMQDEAQVCECVRARVCRI